MKNKFYIVYIIRGDKLLYFKGHQSRELQGPALIFSELIGIFSPDLSQAKKFSKKLLAQFCAASFEGAHVKSIKWGAVVK